MVVLAELTIKHWPAVDGDDRQCFQQRFLLTQHTQHPWSFTVQLHWLHTSTYYTLQ